MQLAKDFAKITQQDLTHALFVSGDGEEEAALAGAEAKAP